MELSICGRLRELEKIKQSDFKKVLSCDKPLLVFGASGIGKSAIVSEYAEETGKQLIIINLAMEMPETMGGVPYAITSDKVAHFKRLLDEKLIPVMENEGENVIIFFDEINQASPEVYNTMYNICHPDASKRNWNGHSLAKAQIVGAGNKNDGSDGTVYLNDLPVPLLNRFFIAELVSSKEETKKYLKTKWKNIPQVVKYIDVLLENEIPPRDIDQCLEIIQYEMDGLLLQMKLGSALTRKMYDIQNKVKTADPAKILKACRQSYEIFKEDGIVQWASETIEEEEELLDRFREVLSEEEIASIVKGVE